ncbi:MAG: SDR family oxidoreductase [Chlorobia bacterium]|nr:SDR family oxidoreductase [Fimbriimonadaceae bacterium]
MPGYLDLSGKVALITGGSSGIGKGAAIEMAKQGAGIALIGRTPDELEETRQEISETGTCRAYTADISNSQLLKSAIDHAARDFGRLDIVFANAGINGVWAPIDDITEEEYDQTMDINLKGTFMTIKFAVPHLRKQEKGSIIVTSSVNGTRMFSNTGATIYSTSKAGQVAMAKMLAIELGRQNIRVNVICPGSIGTDIGDNTEHRNTKGLGQPVQYPEGQIPMPGRRTGTIEQVGRLALFLASDASDHINGEVVYIDGGQSLVQG